MATAALATESCRTELVARLRERREEIEQAALARVSAIPGAGAQIDPTYALGLRDAVCDAVEFGVATLEHGSEQPVQVPVPLLAQARLAARNGVGVETVLRRYFAGYTLLVDFLVRESTQCGLPRSSLESILRAMASAFDQLVAAIAAEYEREARPEPASTDRHRVRRIERLLAGELIGAEDLGYDLEGHHIGIVASGGGAMKALDDLAAALQRRPLTVRPEGEVVWAWLGGLRQLEQGSVVRLCSTSRHETTRIAVGEPAQGLAGWRLTHRQARAAHAVVVRSQERCVRYGDVALLAAVLQDDLLATSLTRAYLAPLQTGRDRGAVLRETLRAYFASECNVSSTAQLLGVARRTVNKRLLAIEERVGRPVHAGAAEMQIALRLHEFRQRSPDQAHLGLSLRPQGLKLAPPGAV